MRAFIPLLVFLAFSCKPTDHSALMRENLNREIQNRLQILKVNTNDLNEPSVSPDEIHTESQRLITLSRDHENFSNMVKHTNAYFMQMARVIFSNKASPELLTQQMNPVEAQLLILQNELWLLNEMAFQTRGKEIHLFSVLEKK